MRLPDDFDNAARENGWTIKRFSQREVAMSMTVDDIKIISWPELWASKEASSRFQPNAGVSSLSFIELANRLDQVDHSLTRYYKINTPRHYDWPRHRTGFLGLKKTISTADNLASTTQNIIECARSMDWAELHAYNAALSRNGKPVRYIAFMTHIYALISLGQTEILQMHLDQIRSTGQCDALNISVGDEERVADIIEQAINLSI